MRVRAKFKKCRRYGAPIFGKCASAKFAISEQKRKTTGPRRRTMITEYGKQLIEKQKLKFSYFLKEKKLKKYVFDAIDSENETFGEIYKSLETRLDNVIYRTGLAESRIMAKQIVGHGHILVNGRKLNVPSYAVKIGDKIAVREESKDRSIFQNLEKKDLIKLPNWLSFDYKKLEGEIKEYPKFEKGEFDFQQIIEFYTR
ncbi:MAG: 30S ribosomal protein S4 [Candidatus Pacebacteria bacterium]|nr:30S ribosomal protein S4 [Candidatus Paceibacterota bacterium]